MSSLAAGLAFLATFASLANAGASGSGVTTRYWDCCKPSCGWPGKASVSNPVQICDVNNNPLSDPNTQSACDSGSSYMCGNQQPFVINDTLAMGFAAVNIAGGTEASWCCACYSLTFTSTSLASSGKTYIVQAVNTGGDLGSNQFDLAFPGGGFGIFDACATEWNDPASNWGAQYGGVSAEADCSQLPAALQPGCEFRFGWFEGADNPSVNFEQVQCPTELTQITGCTRDDDASEPAVVFVGGGSPPVASSSYAATVAAPSEASSKVGGLSLTLQTTSSPKSTNGVGTNTALAGQWQQCGGSAYVGPTSCSPPYTCQTQNPWYAQCL